MLAQPKALDFWKLTKPRIMLMIVLTTLVGFYLGLRGTFDFARLLHTLIGTALTAGGASALNMLLERDVDARMRRTRNRPLPAGQLKPGEALAFGLLFAMLGVLYLALVINRLAGWLAVATLGLYLGVYTPLKRKSTKLSPQEDAQFFAYIALFIGYGIAYLGAEATLALRPHPIHWLVAGIGAVVVGGLVYAITLWRLTHRG